MSKSSVIIGLLVVLVSIGVFMYMRDTGTTDEENGKPADLDPALAKRLEVCESIPQGTTQEVVETTRIFINLPEDVYPFENREFTSKDGAMAGIVTNGEGAPPRHTPQEEFDANHCASHYYEFSGRGTLDLDVKSAVAGTPDYRVKFIVKGW